jgi:hypothetical protein
MEHILKNCKTAGGVAQEEKHLPSKYEALSSNPSTSKNNNNKKENTARKIKQRRKGEGGIRRNNR